MKKAKKKIAKKKTGIDLVTNNWVAEKMEEYNLTMEELAGLLFTSKVQLYQWLSGFRSPSKPSRALLYYVLTYYPYISKKEK